ncbi:MAG: hypothetical protein ABJI92_03280 [Kangiellaceae bacterium]
MAEKFPLQAIAVFFKAKIKGVSLRSSNFSTNPMDMGMSVCS